jgi:hypothetical protein
MSTDLEMRSSQTLFLPGDSDEEGPSIKTERKPHFFASSDDERDSGIAPPTSSSPGPSNGDSTLAAGTKRKPHFFYDSDQEQPEEEEDVDLDMYLNPEAYAEKRRKVMKDPTYAIPAPSQNEEFKAAYLGEFIIDDAYTTLSGRGHIKSGDQVYIIRDLPFAPGKGKRKVSGGNVASSSSNTTKASGMKQGKLNFAPAATSKKSASNKEDNVIIRFENRVRMGMLPCLLFKAITSHDLFFRNWKATAEVCDVDGQIAGSG